ncbi:MAG: ergothioneine biosynthesis protein EgtB [Kangiella sp.]|jgi:ergothioneine biosynthesis protein EgtB|nr:ergothioneine biosynthesis protein EgtB [Kangiella sp.]
MLDQVKEESSTELVEQVLSDFIAARLFTEQLCEPLTAEDYNLQAIAETSPVKWHLAHTSWFFETFIIKKFSSSFAPFNPRYEYLFNSYYNAIGEQFPRPQRGLLSRPSVKEVYEYRQWVTEQIKELVSSLVQHQNSRLSDALSLIRLGINHEQQHQELLLTDLKYNLFQNPVLPAYRSTKQLVDQNEQVLPIEWIRFDEKLVIIGTDIPDLPVTQNDFAYDNETPSHKFYRHQFSVANRLTTNGEYLAFIEEGGYQKPQYWLSDGWDAVREHQWQAPLYWFKKNDDWFVYTLNGVKPLNLNEPVAHVSYYEADAFARWSDARLLTEQEWESIAGEPQLDSNSFNLVDNDVLHPVAATSNNGLQQLYGDVWEWTSSAYAPYPGFKAAAGAVGEYNGKFMCNQYVLRGGSCVTSQNHIRKTYRNFFYPDSRWQFSGIRLARDI